tara:strand:+ start:2234 stop:2419 length:186 start_codon:yes stop_codon:yes gene_type:complete
MERKLSRAEWHAVSESELCRFFISSTKRGLSITDRRYSLSSFDEALFLLLGWQFEWFAECG